jgi:RNA polymerase sigma-70 factor, ECF subfamily
MDGDNELVQRAQNGDTQAFGELVLKHQQFVYNLALRGLGNPEDAQDLAQEAFLKAWRGLPSFRKEAQFRTWLYRITVNLCYNRRPQMRKEIGAQDIDSVVEMADTSKRQVAEQAEFEEMRRYLLQKLEDLPRGYRILILLRYQQGLSYDEMAEVMDVPLGTIKTGLFRAHQLLRGALLRLPELSAVE